ncbi:hypothetical protein Pmani_012213 [Petrolisthes manimaculis]|uniref:RNA-directed DNA polymerase n=1 Tax=Petrolisthes manimaculis TaxID=1843537 RepID=A0AAE1PYC9_9EUCA|nr:hypothetical protein Pmani_012213 [Petrolisthes manimaculis]
MLATDDVFIVYGPRLLIPLSLRRETLARLHDGHQGMERTKRRARQTIYWPGIDRDIENIVSGCSRCRQLLPSHPNEPLWQDSDRSERVFESVSADYFHVAGRTYLVYIDRLSGWLHVTACPRHASADHPIRILRSMFADTGVPVILRTDGGPQFTSSSWQLAADGCDAKADHLREQVKIRLDSSARSLPLLHLGGHPPYCNTTATRSRGVPQPGTLTASRQSPAMRATATEGAVAR